MQDSDSFHDQDGNLLRRNPGGAVVLQALNPVTRSTVTLAPPLDARDLDVFRPAFSKFCQDAWGLPSRRDPATVNPQRVIDGTEPVDTLADAVASLVAEHGVWALQDALTAHLPKVKDPFGPLSPIMPVPVGEPDPGAPRPDPRLWDYRLGGLPS